MSSRVLGQALTTDKGSRGKGGPPAPMDPLDAVTLLIRTWAKAANAAGDSWEKLGKSIGVSGPALWSVASGSRRAGEKMERGFAALKYEGSIDKLRDDAVLNAKEQPEHLVAAHADANRAEAADICRRSKHVSEEAILDVLADPPQDISTLEWIQIILLRDMRMRTSTPPEGIPSSRRARDIGRTPGRRAKR